jgi:YfiH family protein
MIRAPAFDGLRGVSHGFFTREGGVSKGVHASLNVGLGSSDNRESVLANRDLVADRLGVPRGMLAMPHQIHSPLVARVDEPWAPGAGPEVDALVTTRPGIAIGVSTADCGPILFADVSAGVVGAAHAGWKGAIGGVIEATIEAMEGLGADRARTVAVLGPTISAGAYEVGSEFVDRFVMDDKANEAFFRPSDRSGHAMFNLPAYIIGRLKRADVQEAVDLGLCTYIDEARFFSFRRMTHRGEPDYGRLVSAIALKP